jgi:hypothetical protein
MPNFREQTIFPEPGIRIHVGMARFIQEAAGKAFAKKFRVLLADWFLGNAESKDNPEIALLL